MPESSQPAASKPVAGIYGGHIPATFFATRRTTRGFTPATLHLQHGQIAAVEAESPHPGPGLNAAGCVVLPGFIDIHIHGIAGHDLMDADPRALDAMARVLVRHGVTGFLPTTLSAPHAEILAALQRVVQFQAPAKPPSFTGARILGAHLEGPYLSPDYPGAQSPQTIRAPRLAEFCAYLDTGVIRLVTLAPEQPGADALIAEARRRGVAVAIGHSAATYDQALAAFEQGVDHVTHTYNAMPGLHHRTPGLLGATLADDRVYAQLIADGIHVHPAAMSILARCKQPAKTILITDAMRAAGLGPGRYHLGGLPVIVQDGACRLESGALAGSLLTMDAALNNFMAATGLPLDQAWVCTSHTPARALGLDRELGSIARDFAADLVVLDADLQVVATVVAGQLVYLRDPERFSSASPG